MGWKTVPFDSPNPATGSHSSAVRFRVAISTTVGEVMPFTLISRSQIFQPFKYMTIITNILQKINKRAICMIYVIQTVKVSYEFLDRLTQLSLSFRLDSWNPMDTKSIDSLWGKMSYNLHISVEPTHMYIFTFKNLFMYFICVRGCAMCV